MSDETFFCAVCRRHQNPQRLTWRAAAYREWDKPPVCFSCANTEGPQVRPAGMTRGDHHQMQRLGAVIYALRWTGQRMKMEKRYGPY